MDIETSTAAEQIRHATAEELRAGLATVTAAPADRGVLELLVRRPAMDGREILQEGRLDPDVGLVGDNWNARTSPRTEDGSPHPDMQLNIISARVSALLADADERRALAGDQLHVDLDLSEANVPAGTRLAIGAEAIVEVTDQPHRGCVKFRDRFGAAALAFVSGPQAMALHLRGVNAKVIRAGTIRQGDEVRKLQR